MIYPNPATHSVSLVWHANSSGTAMLKLIDATGKIVQSMRIDKVQGRNLHRLELPARLAAGRYLLRMESESDSFTENLMIRR
jgi:hypothetical protein